MSCDVGEVTERLENELCYDYNYELCSFSNLFVVSPTSQLILHPFRCFTYITAHSPTLPSLLLRHSLFTYVTWRAANGLDQEETFKKMTELILQPFCHFIYAITHSPTLPSLYLPHSSFSDPSVASPTSQFILQPFFRFSYVTSSSLNSSGEPIMSFTSSYIRLTPIDLLLVAYQY